MADEASIITGSYKGIPITITGGSLDGGRRKSIKVFPNRDTQSVEDLGQIPRKYSVDIILSDKQDQDYFNYRDRLLDALESKGVGVLIHPLYGRIERVAVKAYSLNESYGEFGFATVSVNFEIDRNLGIPQNSGNVLSQISEQNKVVQAAVESSIAEEFAAPLKNLKNFEDAVEKVTGFIDRVNRATAFTGDAASNLNEFSALLGGLSKDVNSLVTNPLALADAVTRVFSAVGSLYSSASVTLDTMLGFFDFGDNDKEINPTTISLVQRATNRSVLNSSIQSAALGYAFLSATRLDYQTTREIEATAELLENQFIKVMAGDTDQGTKDQLSESRLLFDRFLQQARLRASALITVNTPLTTARLLAFDYYGTDADGELLAVLNDVENAAFVEGDVEILTE